jgi:NAD-dependent deacetylase
VASGAGISAESGIPTFRGTGGLWEGFRAEDLASPEGFRRDPEKVWRWYRWRRETVAGAQPNDAHRAIASLEASTAGFTLATQNVDDLHERAGSRNVIHLHGEIMRSRCLRDCGREVEEDPDAPIPMCACGAPLRPAVVWFGEVVPEDRLESAFEEAGRCDVCLVVGTSGVVYPAAGIPLVARRAGAFVIEVNPEETPITDACDLVLRGPAARLLPPFLAGLHLCEEPTAGGGV